VTANVQLCEQGWWEMSEQGLTDLDTRYTSDERFIRELRLARQIRSFLLEQGVVTAAAEGAPRPSFALGRLNLINFREKAPAASFSDWVDLEEIQNRLQGYFTPELQKRFRLRNTQRLITWTPVVLLLMAALALALAIFPPNWVIWNAFSGTDVTAGWVFGSYLAWTASLGALGSLAFLAVNSLSIQTDATFDLCKPLRSYQRAEQRRYARSTRHTALDPIFAGI
jgi:hypothetical protein